MQIQIHIQMQIQMDTPMMINDEKVQRSATQRGEEIKRLQGELERQQVIVVIIVMIMTMKITMVMMICILLMPIRF